MSECKFCKSKQRQTYDSETKYECGSHFFFSSHYNQSNACKTITHLQSRISELEKEKNINHDKAYFNGLKAGWNLGVDNRVDEFKAATKSFEIHLDEARLDLINNCNKG